MYWNYEWSYNEYMLHRVGKLSSVNGLYDMLGNVWEWVRDDYLGKNDDGETDKLTGGINPIALDTTNNYIDEEGNTHVTQ